MAGSDALGGNVSALGSLIVSGGASGASYSAGPANAGGNVTGAGPIPTIPGGVADGGNGNGGYASWKPLCFCGGSGGGFDSGGDG